MSRACRVQVARTTNAAPSPTSRGSPPTPPVHKKNNKKQLDKEEGHPRIGPNSAGPAGRRASRRKGQQAERAAGERASTAGTQHGGEQAHSPEFLSLSGGSPATASSRLAPSASLPTPPRANPRSTTSHTFPCRGAQAWVESISYTRERRPPRGRRASRWTGARLRRGSQPPPVARTSTFTTS